MIQEHDLKLATAYARDAIRALATQEEQHASER